jgi:ribA/ribD-fused uncharacterized protein
MAIKEFRGRYECLSNFAPVINNLTVEHWYQANKTTNREWQAKILNAPTPNKAKQLSKELKDLGLIREEFYLYNKTIMLHLVMFKFMFRADYRDILFETDDQELVEGNWWHDNFWGDCTCGREDCLKDGQNHLGKILVSIRQYLRIFSAYPSNYPRMSI